MRDKCTQAARMFKAVCDESRIQILEQLHGGEACACKLLERLQIKQSTLSHHMKVLCDAGLVVPRKEGRWMHYSINDEGGSEAVRLLRDILHAGSAQAERHPPAAPPADVAPRKQLYVLTGFLGAGKTSLLLHLLDALAGKKVGVIQNEFGKLGVDGEILRRDGMELTEISRGSIFCSCLKLSFVQALAELGGRDLEYVFVESSGLADPSNIEEILGAVEALAGDCYDFKGVICLVDAVNFLEQLSDVETVDRQLAHCHLAAVNKADLVDDTQLAEVLAAVRRVNPACAVTVCRDGDIGTDFLQEDLTARGWAACEDSLNREDNKPKTLSLSCGAVLPRQTLEAFLQAVLPECHRIKGFFHLEEGWHQVDVVGRLVDLKNCPDRGESRLVFLSKVGPQVIRTIDAAWSAATDVPMKLKN